jgi:hypothetical protein
MEFQLFQCIRLDHIPADQPVGLANEIGDDFLIALKEFEIQFFITEIP